MSWPGNPLVVPEIEVGIEKSCAKDVFELFLLFLLFVFYLNGVSILRWVECHLIGDRNSGSLIFCDADARVIRLSRLFQRLLSRGIFLLVGEPATPHTRDTLVRFTALAQNLSRITHQCLLPNTSSVYIYQPKCPETIEGVTHVPYKPNYSIAL